MKSRPAHHFLDAAVDFAVSGGYIELAPDEREDPQVIINKLVTSMLYESRRHGWEAGQCRQMRYHLSLLEVKFSEKEQSYFEDYIRKQEQLHCTYYGSYLSDNSDSEEEEEFQAWTDRKKIFTRSRAKTFRKHADIHKIIYVNTDARHEKGNLKLGAKPPTIFETKKRQTIYHGQQVDMGKVARDLDLLNDWLDNPWQSLEGAIEGVSNRLKEKGETLTSFYIAEYRGVTHNTSLWGQQNRKAHRQDKGEIGGPQYSAAVYEAAGLNLFKDYEAVTQLTRDSPEIIDTYAELLREILLTLREPMPCSYGSYSYSSLAYLIQNIYTQDYHGFLEFIKNDPQMKKILLNGSIPFVSTGNVVYHALRYALSLKAYAGYDMNRLQPRWRQDGRAERPYSGVVYVSLHPITDFNKDGPLHVVSMNRAAEIKLLRELLIISERESTFPSFLPKDRVIHKHVAKYPSFDKPYRDIYFHKYGLTKREYDKFRAEILSSNPHTQERKKAKDLLAETLCSYHEAKLIDVARVEAERKGGVLIYRDINGKFSLKPPIDSVFRPSKEDIEKERDKVKSKQEVRASYASNRRMLISLASKAAQDSILENVPEYWDEDIAGVAVEGNHTMSVPATLMLNAIIHKRYLALEYFLKQPIFIEAINERINMYRLKGGTLLHLAVLADDVTAIDLLMKVPSCDMHVGAEELIDEFGRCCGDSYYEKITPAQLALIRLKNEIVLKFIKDPRHDPTKLCDYVENKNLLFSDEMMECGEDDGSPGVIGYAFHHREGVGVERISNNSLLHVAVAVENKEIIPSLLSAYPGSMFYKNSDHQTPAGCALREGKKDFFDLLRAASLAQIDKFHDDIEAAEKERRSHFY